jgi:hypothetical protein
MPVSFRSAFQKKVSIDEKQKQKQRQLRIEGNLILEKFLFSRDSVPFKPGMLVNIEKKENLSPSDKKGCKYSL